MACRIKYMRSLPYANIDPKVARVVQDILKSADGYHQAHVARLTRTAEILVNEAPAGRLLELGTTGFLPLVLEKLRPDIQVIVTHFDLNAPQVMTRVFTVGNKSIDLEAYHVNLEADALPVEDASVDTVVCCEVLEHMEVDPMFMLSGVNRVLKNDGLLFLTTPNVLSSRGLHKIVRGIEPYFFMHYHESGKMYRHNYEYSAKSLAALLMAAGFTPDVWTEDLFEDPVLDTVKALRAAGFVIKDVGDNLLARARKVSDVVDRYPRGLYV